MAMGRTTTTIWIDNNILNHIRINHDILRGQMRVLATVSNTSTALEMQGAAASVEMMGSIAATGIQHRHAIQAIPQIIALTAVDPSLIHRTHDAIACSVSAHTPAFAIPYRYDSSAIAWEEDHGKIAASHHKHQTPIITIMITIMIAIMIAITSAITRAMIAFHSPDPHHQGFIRGRQRRWRGVGGRGNRAHVQASDGSPPPFDEDGGGGERSGWQQSITGLGRIRGRIKQIGRVGRTVCVCI
mmetsp:Transcript_5740/g.10938  ORF Transcript_5740/g.10938 Transcript_5740/m.10938 type:complete len:243 (-) Transcript_5740:50-778(-)